MRTSWLNEPHVVVAVDPDLDTLDAYGPFHDGYDALLAATALQSCFDEATDGMPPVRAVPVALRTAWGGCNKSLPPQEF